MESIGRALNTPSNAPAPQSNRLSASRVRRRAAVPAPSAARMANSFSRRTVRARIRFATLEQAITKTSSEAASSTSRTVLAREVIWSRRRTASILTSDFGRVGFGVFLHNAAVDGAQFRAGLFEIGAGSETAEQFRHAVDPSGHHGGRQMMRAGDDVGDDFGFRRIGHRRLQHAHDGGRACAEANGLTEDGGIALERGASKIGKSTPLRPVRPDHRRACQAGGRAPGAIP